MLKQIIFITAITIMSSTALSSLALAEITPHASTSAEQKQITTQTVTLSVPGMTCPVCLITVKKALSHVAGVEKVIVNFNAKTAVVRFNPQQSKLDQLIQATMQVGYSSYLLPVAK